MCSTKPVLSSPDDETAGDIIAAATDQQVKLLRNLQLLTGRLGEASLKVLVGETVSVLERHYIEAALASTAGNRSAAARILGLSRQSLYVKLARYGIVSD